MSQEIELIFSDLHAHVWKKFGLSKDGKMSKRLAEQEDILKQIIEIVIKRKIKRVICGGDILHKVGEVPVEAVNIVRRFFLKLDSLGVEYLLDDGNHDLVDRKAPKWYQSASNIFRSNAKCPETIKFINFNDEIDYGNIKGYELVVLHKTPVGAQVGNYIFGEGADWRTLAANNKMVIFGHIHQRQQLSENCYVIGSPMHLTFGDIGERGVYLLDGEGIEFVKLRYPEFRTVATENEVPWDDDYHYYRVLEACKKSENENVVNIVKPKYFEERLKGENFSEILNEWITLQGRDSSYLKPIRHILEEKTIAAKTIFKGKISGVAIRDFMSIGTIKYKLIDGLTVIKGENADADSNGSGKTSMLDAIYWCLYGKTTKGLTGDDVIRDRPEQQKDCEVIVGLVDGTQRIRISRTRRKGLRVEVASGEGLIDIVARLRQADRQKVLEEQVLGFNGDVFLASCYFSQENLQMLTSLSDSDKTNMITNLLGFEQYDNLQDMVKEEIKQTEANLRLLESNLVTYKSELQSLNAQIAVHNQQRVESLVRINEGETLIVQYREYIERLRETPLSEKMAVVDYDAEIACVEQELTRLNGDISGFEGEITKLSSAAMEQAGKLGEKSGALTHFENRKRELEGQLNNLDGLNLSEQCDKCGSVITEGVVEKFKEEKKQAIEDVTVGFEATAEICRTHGEENKRLTTLVAEKLSLKEECSLRVKDLNKSISEIQKKKLEQITKISEIEKEQEKRDSEIEKYKSLIKNQEKVNYDYNLTCDAVKEKVDALNTFIINRHLDREETKKIIEVGDESVKVLEFWKEAFSNKGIRSLLLDKFCNEFNNIINQYMADISNNRVSILANPISNTKSGEERNKISFDVVIDGQERKYIGLSGGEKRRVDTALCLSLNKWVGNRYQVKNGLLGMLILDELFSYIDREGEESIASLLSSEALTKTIFVISHTTSLVSFARNVWTVVKKGGVSKLELT